MFNKSVPKPLQTVPRKPVDVFYRGKWYNKTLVLQEYRKMKKVCQTEPYLDCVVENHNFETLLERYRNAAKASRRQLKALEEIAPIKKP